MKLLCLVFSALLLAGCMTTTPELAQQGAEALLRDAELRLSLGQSELAQRRILRAFEICEEKHDVGGLAACHYENGKYLRIFGDGRQSFEQAREQQSKAIELYRQDSDNPGAAAAYAERAQLNFLLGDRAAALGDYDMALAVYRAGKAKNPKFYIPVPSQQYPTFELLIAEFRRQAETVPLPTAEELDQMLGRKRK